MKALDIAQDATSHAPDFANAGIEAIGFYARADRASKAFIDGLAVVGIHRFAIFERGKPTSAAYFTQPQACHDATSACAFLHLVGMPASKPVFHCVDYDADVRDLGLFLTFFAQLQTITKQAGFLLGAYAPGWLLLELLNRGIIHYGMLPQSHGWQGYASFLPKAAIVQGPETKVLGFDVDLDTIMDTSVVW